MSTKEKHLILQSDTVRDALLKLNLLGSDAILFLIDDDNKLLGSLTDGDLRRGFIRGLSFEDALIDYVQPNPVFVMEGRVEPDEIEVYRKRLLKVIPVLDEAHAVVDILNLRITESVLPLEAIIMAGGRGQRLMPLTAEVPKPMLHVGDKPILEHNIDRLKKFGIRRIHISVNYKADVIRSYFKDGSDRDLNIFYVQEDKPLGTCGSVKLIQQMTQEYLLIMNSDLLTDIDFADFFKSFQSSGADMAVAATGYEVDVPYAVLEVNDDRSVISLKEKPRYTFYSNAGIYLLKKDLLELIPHDAFFNITDLMELIIADRSRKLITYPMMGYWLDIGKHEDFKKAQEDIRHLKL
jgi:dTDP-glucose pyrophosphorylase